MLAKTKFTVLLFFSVILTGCATAQTVATAENCLLIPTSTLASITSTSNHVCIDETDIKPNNVATLELSSLPIEFESGTDWFSPQVKDGLTFYIRGMYAINKDIAFIFGGLTVPVGTVRSLLLRSVDGGNHWKEVMPPTNLHDITQVVFIGNGEGWAIATRTLEGESGTKLWHTTDYGETWQKNSNYHLPVASISGIRIFDNRHIQFKTLLWSANPKTDRYAIFDSRDGGTSWQENFSVALNEDNYYAVIEAYSDTPGGRYGSYYLCTPWNKPCDAFGQDGSKWQIENIYGNQCINGYSFDNLLYAEVRHLWQDHESKFAIPLYFYYKGNEIHVRP